MTDHRLDPEPERDWNDRGPTCTVCGSGYHVEILEVDGDLVDLCPEHASDLLRCSRCGESTQRKEAICWPCQEAADHEAEREVEMAREESSC